MVTPFKFSQFLLAIFLIAPNPAQGLEQAKPLFIERIPRSEFDARLAIARELAARVAQTKATFPAQGFKILHLNPTGAAAQLSIAVGDIMTHLDGKPFDISVLDMKSDKTRQSELTIVTPGQPERKLTLPAGTLGIDFIAFERDPVQQTLEAPADPRWSDNIRVALAIQNDDPAMAETLFARAVASGLPRSERLETIAVRLALCTRRFDDALAISAAALAHSPRDTAFFNESLRCAALASGDISAALPNARIPQDDKIKAMVPKLEELFAAEKVAPNKNARLATLAAKLFHDDLLVRSELIGGSLLGLVDSARRQNIKDNFRDMIPGNQRMGERVPANNCMEDIISPGAKNVRFSCRFVLRPTDTVPARFQRKFHFGLCTVKEVPHQLDKTPHLVTDSSFAVEFNAMSATTMVVYHSPLPKLTLPLLKSIDDGSEHSLDVVALNGRLEFLYDGAPVLRTPLLNQNVPLYAFFGCCGADVEFFDLRYNELLTDDECKARIVQQINTTYLFKWTRLHRVAQWGSKEAVAQLLKMGAKVDVEDVERRTPLLLAAEHNQLEVVKLLLERGADATRFDVRGRNAWTIANEKKYTELAAFLAERFPDLKKGVKPPKQEF